MTLHFAYGSNMARAPMARRCPHAQALGVATLADWRFVISADGYASVMPCAGRRVHGVLWRLTPRDLAALNAYESLDSGLYGRIWLSVRRNGKAERAMIYLGRAQREGRPRPGYLAGVLAAARDWRLPGCYIAELARWTSGDRPACGMNIGAPT